MKNFIKNNLKVFVTMIITTIIVGSVSVYAASQYFAKDITFTPTNEKFKKENGEAITNVEDALNELYDKNSKSYCSGNFQVSSTNTTIIDCGFNPNHIIVYDLNTYKNDPYIWEYDNGKFYVTQNGYIHREQKFSIDVIENGFSFKGYDFWYDGTAYYIATR